MESRQSQDHEGTLAHPPPINPTELYATIRLLRRTNGADLVSTWVTKPEVHAEVQLPRKSNCKTYSCQRRQLRTSSLNTCLSALGLTCACALRSPGSTLTRSR
jgi:hypothetical protein